MGGIEKDTTGKTVAPRSGWLSPFDEIDKYFEDVFPSRWPAILGQHLRPPFEGRWPKVDVIDREAEVLVRAELPGVKKEDLDLTVTDMMVSIKATTQQEEKEEKGTYVRHELRRGEFQRTIPLAQAVNGDQAKATFKDGVLELVIPKVTKSPRKSVKIE